MHDTYVLLSPLDIVLICVVAVIAGVVKGAVGFAMPMILISSLGSFLPPHLALGALIFPTLLTNLWQALRQGIGPALASAMAHRLYIGVLLVCIVLGSLAINLLSDRALFLALGIPLTGFALIQLSGLRFHIPPRRRKVAEVGIGGVAGLIGGLSGVWGPPTVLYLTALDTPKTEQVRVQGVIYGAGAVFLTLAHLRSGVLNGDTAPLSAAICVPAALGMVIGLRLHDRMDQGKFRTATLVVLVVASLNLIRRGLAG